MNAYEALWYLAEARHGWGYAQAEDSRERHRQLSDEALTTIQGALVENKRQIETLHREVDFHGKSVVELRAALAARDAESMQLREALAAKEGEIARLRELESENSLLRAALARRIKQFGLLREAIETHIDNDRRGGLPEHYQRTRGLRDALSGEKGE